MAKLRHFLRPFWIRLGFSAIIALAFVGAVQSISSYLHRQDNVMLLKELNLRTLQRAEALVDYAIESMADLQLSGLSSCDEAALAQIRKISYLRGSIKDIQVLDANHGLLCSGSNLGEELGIANFDFSASYPAEQEHIYFHDIARNNSGILGVARHVNPETTFLAVLNLDSLLFGVFPDQVRDAARADLLLGDEVEVATQLPDVSPENIPSDIIEFTQKSDRFPLEVRFSVSAGVLDVWNNANKRLVSDISIVLGLLLGWALVVYFSRPVPLVQKMRDALERGEFVPFMQPTFDIAGRQIIGCEVLMRWVKSDGEIIPPFRFIPTAEESGLILEMTRVVMADALDKLSDHMRQDKNFKVAFNIVPSDLISNDFSAEICKIIKTAGVARRQVVLEITERQEFSDLDKAIKTIKDLRELGFRVALDDTGVGHNGLSNVQLLGADIIKIDKLFIDRVGVDASATTIVQMLVRLAQELGMRTVAEGIETEQQLSALLDCQVDEGQGYLISKPVAFDVFLQLVENDVVDRSKSHADKNAA